MMSTAVTLKLGFLCDDFVVFILGDVPCPHNRAITSRENVGHYRLFHQLPITSKATS